MEPGALMSPGALTVRFLIYGIFNYMGFLIHGPPEPPPGPSGPPPGPPPGPPGAPPGRPGPPPGPLLRRFQTG